MRYLKHLCMLAALMSAVLCSIDASAQFKSEAFSQQYNSDPAGERDSTDVLFSFKEYFGGLRHENTLKIGTMAAGSALFIGGNQIYNKQYWKLPIVYATIGGGIGTGIYFNATGHNDIAKYCFIGAGVAYWATMMDGVASYSPSEYPHAGKATLYSILVPGLGQIYNREYWKLPLYLGLMAYGVHFYTDCSRNFERFRSIYLQATDSEAAYDGPITADQALYYRNIYRRYRDYSLLAIAAVYLLQVIDANVFSYMHNFEVDDDISMNMSPTVIMPDQYNLAFGGGSGIQNPAIGLRLGIRF